MSADASDAKRTMSMSAGNLGLPFRHKIDKQDQIYEITGVRSRSTLRGFVSKSIFLVTKKIPGHQKRPRGVACRGGRFPPDARAARDPAGEPAPLCASLSNGALKHAGDISVYRTV
jgi:hypothetical protein